MFRDRMTAHDPKRPFEICALVINCANGLVTRIDEIDAELDRQRLEAQQKTARSRKIVKYVGGTFLAIVAVLLVVFLGRYSDLVTTQMGLVVLGNVAILVALEVAALKLNSRRENPWPEAAISVFFLVLLFVAISIVI